MLPRAFDRLFNNSNNNNLINTQHLTDTCPKSKLEFKFSLSPDCNFDFHTVTFPIHLMNAGPLLVVENIRLQFDRAIKPKENSVSKETRFQLCLFLCCHER